MAKQQTCTFLYGVYGVTGPQVPIWADDEATPAITAALVSNLSVSHKEPPVDEHEGDFAVLRTLKHLVQDGTIPQAVFHRGLSEEDYAAAGYEDYTTWQRESSLSLQDHGSPPFKSLDISHVLFTLRQAARCQEIEHGNKLIFQLGVLNYIINGKDHRFQAQVFRAEDGKATHTVWLYRYCVFRGGAEYEEHWRAFMAPAGGRIAVIVEDIDVLAAGRAPVPAPAGQVVPKTPQKSGQTAYQTPPATRKRKQPQDEDTAHGTPDPDTAPAPTPQTPAPGRLTKAYRTLHYSNFDYTALTPEQLLAVNQNLLMGDAILHLAEYYSNKDIFEGVNRHSENKIKDPNVVTKRITNAIEAAVKNTGRTEEEFRDRLSDARAANGVKHKGKINTSAYRRKPRRGDGGGEA